MEAIEVRRCTQALITEKVNRDPLLDQLVSQYVAVAPGQLVESLVQFVAVCTVVPSDIGDPINMLSYVARSTHQMLAVLGEWAIQATNAAMPAKDEDTGDDLDSDDEALLVAAWIEGFVRLDSKGDLVQHRAAQAMLGALTVPDRLMQEQMFGNLVKHCLPGAHLVIEGLLAVLRSGISSACECGVADEAVVGLLLDRADEIMQGMAGANACSVEEQVARAWMALERGDGAA